MSLPAVPLIHPSDPEQSRPVGPSGWRRIAEAINNILNFNFDASRIRTAAERALGVTPVNPAYPPLNVKRYGAKGDGVTDDWHPINTAFKVAIQQGGGRIVLPDAGVYLLDSYDPASPLTNFPSQANDGTVTYANETVVMYIQNASNIDVDFQGSTIKYGSSVTFGDLGLTFDAFSNVRLIGAKFVGLNVFSGGLVSFGSLTGGSGYTSGSYTNVPLTGGTGGGAVADITVSGGAVTVVTVRYVGTGYAVNDTLSASNTDLGGAGSGFQITVTSITGAGTTVVDAAPDAVSLLSFTGSSTNFTAHDLDVTGCFTCLHATSDPSNSDLTIQNISLTGATRGINVQYGVALHNAGDGVNIESLYVFRCDRPFFFYGVRDVRIKAVGDQVNYGFEALIKAYSRSTNNVHVSYTLQNMPGKTTTAPAISVQVQSGQTTLPSVTDVFIEYADRNVGLDINTSGQAIAFDYLNGTGVLQSTCAQQIFNNFVIKGLSAGNYLYTSVALSGASAYCRINVEDYISPFGPGASNDLVSANGFIRTGRNTYTPTIEFGGGTATGWTFSTNSAEYYLARDGECTVRGHLTVSAKGTATGQISLTTPVPSRIDSTHFGFGQALGNSGMASITGPIVATVSSGGGTSVADLWMQATTGAQALTDTYFSASSDLDYEFKFHA